MLHESEGALQKCENLWRALLHLAEPLLCSVCSEQGACAVLRLEQGGCGDVYGGKAELIPAHLSKHVLRTRTRLLRQYLYFCASKASKSTLSTCGGPPLCLGIDCEAQELELLPSQTLLPSHMLTHALRMASTSREL
jgi:hypothetical protein